jgi:transcriptional regulator GlxA family with amidase domain
VLVAGGLCVADVAADARFVGALTALVERSGEVGSVCSGALLLARTRALDGRRATTHWALAETLAASHPEVAVEADQLFVHDGVWTSAGVTAGIDLALQLVRTHHGSEIAMQAARNMVVYTQRAGGQRQYSAHLAAQRSSSPTIAALAARARMSERSFQRLFSSETGLSPGRYVERCRIDAARLLLEQTGDGLAAVAARSGFASPETLIRAFRRIVGINPTEYRRRFPGYALHDDGGGPDPGGR